MAGKDNQVVKGTFALSARNLFSHRSDRTAGTVRGREGAAYPSSMSCRLDARVGGSAVSGQTGNHHGRCLSREGAAAAGNQRHVWEHIQKGGVVAYAILGVGLLSLLMILQKIRDLSQMRVDNPRWWRVFSLGCRWGGGQGPTSARDA